MAQQGERRTYDIVIVGATGYTGRLTAEHVARLLPGDLKWAIAGRSQSKLDTLAAKLRTDFPNRSQPTVEVVSLTDQARLNALVSSAIVCISVVAYWKDAAGEAVVKACVENRTDYLDVAGEPPLLLDWVAKYHEAAKSAGVALIHNCGAGGAPQDIAAWAAVRELRESSSLKTKEVILSIKGSGVSDGVSSGTLESLLHTFEYGQELWKESIDPWALCPVQARERRPDRSAPSNPANTLGLRRDRDLGLLSRSSMSAFLCEIIVNRTWGLLRGTDADYGPRFRYSEYEAAPSALSGALSVFGSSLIMGILSLAPVRAIIRKFFLAPGDGSGPDVEASRNSRVALEAIAVADVEGGANTSAARARAIFSHPSGAYHVTGILLAQAAASLLYTKKLVGGYAGGCLTPAFLGNDFVRRIREAGGVLRSEALPASSP